MTTAIRFGSCGLLAAATLALLALAGCAQVEPVSLQAPRRALVFPGPPDPPRFVFERAIYSSADVEVEKESDRMRRAVTGEQRGGQGLNKPYAIAVHRGRIYLSDSVDRFVKVFDMPAGRQFTIGDDEPGRLNKPLGIDIDRNGNLYVADSTVRTIMVYDRDGKYLRKIGGPKFFDRLASVTVDPAGTRIYVVDIGGVQSENHRVRVFDAVSGEHLMDIGKRGVGPGEFNLPRDVAIGKGGQLYVVDGGNFRIQVFERDGRYLHGFGTVGRQPGNFARPKEIATDKEGNVYVVDTAFGNFQIFNAEGDLLMFVGDRNEQDGPARYMLPSGIAVDEDGRVYMVDQWFRKIEVYRPADLPADAGWLGKSAVRPPAAK